MIHDPQPSSSHISKSMDYKWKWNSHYIYKWDPGIRIAHLNPTSSTLMLFCFRVLRNISKELKKKIIAKKQIWKLLTNFWGLFQPDLIFHVFWFERSYWSKVVW